MPYLGKTPSQATRQRYYLTASGGETSISGTMTTGGTLTFNDGEFVDVKLNGVSLVAGTDYNTSTANTIAGLSALAANDQVEIVVYDTFSVFSGDVDSNLSVGGNLSVTGTTALTGAATLTAGFTASDGCTITTDDNNPQLTLTTTDADAGTGPTLDLFRDSASPADADVGGKISFTGKNDAGETLGMTIFQASHVDVSDGTEDAKFAISSRSAGSMVSRLNLDATETVFNEDSVDVDFRVESNDQADMFFVDAGNNRVGIGTNAPVNTLDVIDNGGGAAVVGRIRNEGGAAGDDATLELSIATASEEMRILFSDSSGTAGQIVVDGGDNSMAFETGTSERMRIDGSGNIMMGTTSVGGTSVLSLGSSNYMVATHNDGGTSGFFGQIRFRNNANNADVGTINRVNDASVQYNTTSDARLKENIADMTGAIARVKQLSPKRYSWVNEELDAADQDGFLAHEAQTVVPIAVSGTQNEVDDEDNPVYMQMDYSKLVPLLTGALQEAITKIETLETKVAALEAGE